MSCVTGSYFQDTQDWSIHSHLHQNDAVNDRYWSNISWYVDNSSLGLGQWKNKTKIMNLVKFVVYLFTDGGILWFLIKFCELKHDDEDDDDNDGYLLNY